GRGRTRSQAVSECLFSGIGFRGLGDFPAESPFKEALAVAVMGIPASRQAPRFLPSSPPTASLPNSSAPCANPPPTPSPSSLKRARNSNAYRRGFQRL